MLRIFRPLNTAAFFLLVFSLTGCGAAESLSDALFDHSETSSIEIQQDVSYYYSQGITDLVVEVAYEQGAEPYTGNNSQGSPLWTLTTDNINALYANRSYQPSIIVPTALGSMISLADQAKSSWTTDEVAALAAAIPASRVGSNIGRIQVIFLNGYFNDKGTVNKSTLGIQITGTTVIAIFKDVIKGMSTNPNGLVTKYVEQSTVIHEIGHALGLVNNGLGLTSEHQDTEHGHHCGNPKCVMNWLNSGAQDLVDFANHLATTGNNILFGDECLEDAWAYNP